jgi:MFS family permease
MGRRLRADIAFVFGGSLLGLVLILRVALRLGARFTNPVLPLLVEQVLAEGRLLGSASGLLTAASGVAGAVAAPLLGRLADRQGGRGLLLICGLAAGAALILQGLAPNYTFLLVWQVVIGAALGGTLAILSTYIGRLAPEGRSGTAYGLDNTAVSLANATGQFLGGWIGQLFYLRSSFIVGGALMLLSSLGVLRLPKQEET